MGKVIVRKAYVSPHFRETANGPVPVHQYIDTRTDRVPDVDKTPVPQVPELTGLAPFQARILGEKETPQPAPAPMQQLPADQDYAINGIRAASFKNWFGDWERGRDTSRIRHETGEPKLMHPVGRLVDTGDAPEVYGALQSAFPAYHFSEQVSSPTAGQKPSIQNIPAEFRHPVLDHRSSMAQSAGLPPVYPEQEALFLQTGDLRTLYPDTGDDNWKELAGRAGEIMAQPAQPAYLNVRNPLPADKPLERQFRDSLSVADPPLMKQVQRTGGKQPTGQHLLDAMHSMGRAKQLPSLLQSAGYDGITHSTGKGGKQQAIVFAPHQVKAQANVGTFDPAEPDIYKAVTLPSQTNPYTRKHVYTPEFTNWFGYWEGDPENSSKVVHPSTGMPQEQHHLEGHTHASGQEPLVMYHGTAHHFRAFDPARDKGNNLYGKGFYFTDDPDIAYSYQAKEIPMMPYEDLLSSPHYQGLLKEAAGKYGLDYNLPENAHHKQVRQWLRNADYQVKQKWPLMKTKLDQWAETLWDVQEEANRKHHPELGNTVAAYLNIRKPFDMDSGKLTFQKGYKFPFSSAEIDPPGELKRAMKDGGTVPAKHLVHGLSAEGANRVIRDHGYDGITHEGGKVTGGKSHRVWIAFHPNQIKHIENEGTFSPDTDDMYKAIGHKYHQWLQSTVDKWGTTTAPHKAGYILPDGQLLNMAVEGAESRNIDHRSVWDVLPKSVVSRLWGKYRKNPQEYYWDQGMKEWMRQTGALRMHYSPASNPEDRSHLYVHANSPITDAQRHAIFRLSHRNSVRIDAGNGEISQLHNPANADHIDSTAREVNDFFAPLIAKAIRPVSRVLSRQIGDDLGVDWKDVDFDQFHQGMHVEQEHADVTGGDLTKTAKIALAHLKEKRDYYTRLKEMEKGLSVTQAARLTDRNPTEGQKEAGNYQKGKFWWNGMEIAIENPKGSVRRGVSLEGKRWKVTMAHHYGYIKRIPLGADGDPVDIFIGNDLDSPYVYIVDQVDQDGDFDEHKCLIGFKSVEAARKGYLACYSPGWTGLGKITEMTIPAFRAWLTGGGSRFPLAISEE